jgi:hypothetical protein
MIDVKQAVQIGREYLQTFYKPEETPNLMLEEVQRSEDDQYWLITYGFDTNQEVTELVGEFSLANLVRPKYVRSYKQVKIRAEDGQPVSMTIREL